MDADHPATGVNFPRRFTQKLIDLNSATAEELNRLPQLSGHGFEIVRYREERGGFSEVRQLEEVPGLAGKWGGAGSQLRVD